MKETPRISDCIYNKPSAGEKRTKIGACDKLIPGLKNRQEGSHPHKNVTL